MTGPAPRLSLFVVVGLSGASALIFETLFFRLVGLSLGSSVWAVSIVLFSFMVGLALGNWLIGAHGDRLRDPLRTYAVLEVLIGLSGLTLVLLLPLLPEAAAPLFRLTADTPFLMNFIRLGLSFLLMLVPAAAMGMTLPLLVAALVRRDDDFGAALGTMYGCNTLGAVLGALSAERLWVEAFGVLGSGGVAAALNLVAAAGAFFILRHWPESPAEETKVKAKDDEITTAPGPRGKARLLAAAALFGGILLALEVVYFRFFLMFIDGLGWNLAVMLGTVLAGIGSGGLLAARWFAKNAEADRHLSVIALTAGALVAGAYVVLNQAAEAGVRPAMGWVQVAFMFPVSLASGISFTLLGRAVRRHGGSTIQTTGSVSLLNTLGAAVGSLVAGFVLIPMLGMEMSFFLLALAYGIAALLAWNPLGGSGRRLTAAAVSVWLLSLAVFPFDAMEDSLLVLTNSPRLRKQTEFARLFYREGLTETIQYLVSHTAGVPDNYWLVTNNHSMAGTSPPYKRYMKYYVYWPIAVRPQTRDALLISYGVGSTAKALTDTAQLENIDVVDISREILGGSAIVFADPSDSPLNDPRVEVHVEDGRFFLLTTSKTFDLITAEPPPPRQMGVANLYSREFFELAASRLNENGIVTYWLPVYQLTTEESKAVLAGFCETFPDCSLWTGKGLEWMMVGTKIGPTWQTTTARTFSAQWHDPGVQAEMARLGFVSAEQFGALFLTDGKHLRDWIGDVPPLTDNHPQRLASREVDFSESTRREYRVLMNPEESAARFAASEFIKRAWPEPLRTATARHFSAREDLHRLFSRKPDVRLLHATLTDPLLRGYSSWALGSYPKAVEIVASLPADHFLGTQKPVTYRHLAADAVLKGEHGRAARILSRLSASRTEEGLRPLKWCAEAELYLYLASGETDLAVERRDEMLELLADPALDEQLWAFWRWAERAVTELRARP